MTRRRSAPYGGVLFFISALALGLYFTFAAVQGDYGLFRRVEIETEISGYKSELAALESEVAQMENLTRRLSDDYLDIDLLDERARDVIGYIRADEIILN